MRKMPVTSLKVEEKSTPYVVFEGILGHQKKCVIPGINCREVILVQPDPAERTWQDRLSFSLV